MNIADLRFMVVEDNEFQRRWLAIMLANLGAKHVVEAASGDAALAILNHQPVDIGFIDLNMPEMDGLELIRHMAKGNKRTSIVLASALDSSLLFSAGTMSKAYGVHLLGTIEKPVTPDALQSLIHRYEPTKIYDPAVTQGPTFGIEEILDGLREGQIEPYFQPKVDLLTGQVMGAEAFARWRHPRHGVVSPNAFIPVLEEHGQMDSLTWNVIENTATACRKWHDKGFPLSVSINLALSSLSNPALADQIAACIVRNGIAPEQFIVEISETTATTDIPQCLENLLRLRMNGFVLSIDDCGTGHASMQQLLRIPFSELKVDRSFVAGAGSDPSVELVLRSSLELARQLNRVAVAVGVETRHDWNLLDRLGCAQVQGHYIAKPMEGEALPDWMAEWSQFF